MSAEVIRPAFGREPTFDERMAALKESLDRCAEIEREMAQASLDLACDLRAILDRYLSEAM